jgi:hypothetical protein
VALTREEGTTVLITTHYVEEARLADAVRKLPHSFFTFKLSSSRCFIVSRFFHLLVIIATHQSFRKNISLISISLSLFLLLLLSKVGFMRKGRLLVQDSPANLMATHGASSLEDVFLRMCLSAEKKNCHDENTVSVSANYPALVGTVHEKSPESFVLEIVPSSREEEEKRLSKIAVASSVESVVAQDEGVCSMGPTPFGSVASSLAKFSEGSSNGLGEETNKGESARNCVQVSLRFGESQESFFSVVITFFV